MITYRNEGGRIIIEGVKKDRIGQPAIGANVQLIKETSGALYGETTTQLGGYWSFTFLEDNLPSGKYYAKFSGSRLIPKAPPNGDWELIDIVGPDMFDPIQPADIEGLLRTQVTVVDSANVLFEYAVSINATRITITNENNYTVSGVALDYIDQHKDTTLTPDNYDLAYRLTAWTRTPDTSNISAGQSVIYDLTTSIISDAYKVKLHGTNLNLPGLRFKITTRLAADEIDAGRLRIEKGITISNGGASGFIIDPVSLRGIDNSSNTVVALYNSGQNVGTLSNIYAKLGGWAITSTSIIQGVTGSLVEIKAGTNPYISVGDGTDEYARVGYLDTISSVKKNGIWAVLGGFGGAGYADAPTLLSEEGLVVRDEDGIGRAYIGIPLPANSDADGWREPTTTAVTVNNGSMVYSGGLTSWTVSGVISGSFDSTYHSGNPDNYYVTIPITIGTNPKTIEQNISVDGSTAYTVSFWGRRDIDENSTLRLEILDGSTVLGTVYPDLRGVSNSLVNTWVKSSLSFITKSTTTSVTIRFTITSGAAATTNFMLDTVVMVKEEYFTDVSQNGILIHSAANSYVKIGKGVAEIKMPRVEFNDVYIYGSLTTFGTTTTTGATIVSSPIQVLNDSAALATYCGIEIDDTGGDNPMLIYYAGKWGIQLRTSGTAGSQSGSFTSFDKFILQSDIDKVYIESYITVSNVADGTPITIPNSKSYVLGSKKLLVFVNGILQTEGAANDYEEDTTTTVTFNYDLNTGARITFYILGW